MGAGGCEVGEDGQKLQTYSYKIHLSPGGVMHSMVTVDNAVLYLKVAKGVSFKVLITRTKWKLCLVMDVN